ncbi:MAG: replication initiation protein [Helicobacter sp.]|nr:replication initiation protein [Helicobacter sp.]
MFPNFNAKDFDFFMALCFIGKEKGRARIRITFEEISFLIGKKYKDYRRFFNEIDSFSQKMMSVTTKEKRIQEEGFRTSIYGSFFEKIVIKEEERFLLVQFGSEVLFLLNNLTNNYTQFELREFCSLKSKYSKRLYMFLMQYLFKGEFIIQKESLWDILDLNAKSISLQENSFQRKILAPAFNELKGIFKTLECLKQKSNSRGNPIISFKFVFSK